MLGIDMDNLEDETECCCALKKTASLMLDMTDKIDNLAEGLNDKDESEFYKVGEKYITSDIEMDTKQYIKSGRVELATALDTLKQETENLNSLVLLFRDVTDCCPDNAYTCLEQNPQLKELTGVKGDDDDSSIQYA